jgi:hypothetical protein
MCFGGLGNVVLRVESKNGRFGEESKGEFGRGRECIK